MQLIESKTLGTSQASIEFTSIPGDATDLVILASLRSARSDTDDPIVIELNGSAANFSGRELYGNGASVFTTTRTNFVGYIPAVSFTSNTFGNLAMYFPNYAGSTNKSFSTDTVTENNGTTSYQEILASLWSNTAPITSMLFKSGTSNNLVAGSTISLYKITKGSDGIVTTS
jgi:hypothetical protein